MILVLTVYNTDFSVNSMVRLSHTKPISNLCVFDVHRKNLKQSNVCEVGTSAAVSPFRFRSGMSDVKLLQALENPSSTIARVIDLRTASDASIL